MLAKFLWNCLLVSSDTPHPSGSIPPINLAQVEHIREDEKLEESEKLEERDVAEAPRKTLVRFEEVDVDPASDEAIVRSEVNNFEK